MHIHTPRILPTSPASSWHTHGAPPSIIRIIESPCTTHRSCPVRETIYLSTLRLDIHSRTHTPLRPFHYRAPGWKTTFHACQLLSPTSRATYDPYPRLVSLNSLVHIPLINVQITNFFPSSVLNVHITLLALLRRACCYTLLLLALSPLFFLLPPAPARLSLPTE